MNAPNSNLSTNPSGDDFSHLEADLLPLLADLDKLARAEQCASNGLEDRLMQATLGPLHGVQPVNAQVAELGAIDRAGAPADLEQTVYEASAPALQSSSPRLVLHAGGAESNDKRHMRASRRPWWSGASFRMAAMVAVVGAVAVGIYTSSSHPTKPIETAADRVNREMDALFAAVDHATGDAKDQGSVDYDPDKISEWLSEGAAS